MDVRIVVRGELGDDWWPEGIDEDPEDWEAWLWQHVETEAQGMELEEWGVYVCWATVGPLIMAERVFKGGDVKRRWPFGG